MRARARVLTSPLFAVAVTLLALNDHVFKIVWQTPVTGKLSDFAGVTVALILLSVPFGRITAAFITAGGFALLKTVPAVSALAQPLLGGVTLADASDLFALAIVPPAVWWLRGTRRRATAGLGGASPALALPMAFVAVLTTTATSCAEPEMITGLAAEDGRIFATPSSSSPQSGGLSTDEWFVSDDYGQTWAQTAGHPSQTAVFGDEIFCLDDSSCLRAIPEDRLERCRTSSECVTLFDTSDSPVREISECSMGDDQFNSVIVVASGERDVTIVAMGAHGIAFQADDGSWERRAVGDIGVPETPFVLRWFFLGPLITATAGPLIVRSFDRRARVWPLLLAVAVLFLTGAMTYEVLDADIGVPIAVLCAVALLITVGASRPWSTKASGAHITIDANIAFRTFLLTVHPGGLELRASSWEDVWAACRQLEISPRDVHFADAHAYEQVLAIWGAHSEMPAKPALDHDDHH